MSQSNTTVDRAVEPPPGSVKISLVFPPSAIAWLYEAGLLSPHVTPSPDSVSKAVTTLMRAVRASGGRVVPLPAAEAPEPPPEPPPAAEAPEPAAPVEELADGDDDDAPLAPPAVPAAPPPEATTPPRRARAAKAAPPAAEAEAPPDEPDAPPAPSVRQSNGAAPASKEEARRKWVARMAMVNSIDGVVG